jgi:hypothetical protein
MSTSRQENPVEVMREHGPELRREGRERLPAEGDGFDESMETRVTDVLTGNPGYDVAVVGEEGTEEIEGESPDYVALVDPVDGSSAAYNDGRGFCTTGLAVLDDREITENGVSGRPIGSYVIQLGGRGTELSSWRGKPQIDGEVKFTDVSPEDDIPGTVEGTRIGLAQIESLEDLGPERGFAAVYAAKEGRSEVDECFLGPLSEENPDLRKDVWGGSMNDARVGYGANVVAGEPIPTQATEIAGDTFAQAMGAVSRDVYGEENEVVYVAMRDGEPAKTFNSVVTPNEEVMEEVMNIVDVGGLERAFPGYFETYNEVT